MAASETRVGGSAWTVFLWSGRPLAWMQVLSDRAPAPVAPSQAIQPLDEQHPVEIVTPRAVGAGTLTLTNFERWNQQVWQELAGLEGATSILEIFDAQLTLGNITCNKIIRAPGFPNGIRTKVYEKCTITDADESEVINIGTMTLPKAITIMYTRHHYI